MKTTINAGACTPVGRESVKQYGINPQAHNPPPRSSPRASNTMFAGFLSVTLGVCVMAGPRATAALSDDLAHRYSFTTDASDTGTVGGLNGTPQAGVTFASGRAAFNGASTSASQITFASNDIATLAASGGVSIESWGRFDWGGDWATVFKIGAGTWGDQLYQPAGNGQHIYAQAGGNFGSIDNWSLTGLHALSGYGGGPDVHIVNVFNQTTNTISLYVNGALYATGSMGGVSLGSISTTVFNLGGPRWDAVTESLKGSLDEFRIWKKALNAAEIYALKAAGPDTIATVANATNGGATNDWNLATTWSPAAIPDASTGVTINGSLTNPSILLGTGFGTSGTSLALTLTNAGSLAMTGATLSTGLLDTTGGSLTMDATSILNLGGPADTAASLKNVTATTTGATINANGGLTVNSAGSWPGVNIVTNGITVNSGLTFDGTSSNSFKVAGSGNVTVEANGKLVIASAGNSVGNLFLNDNSTLSLEGASASMTVANRPEID
ncbi:MAG: hypothetical protein NTV46_00455, partial [Verrucomicrobia bacterium]|nr:hypothetical protein [Verrucomicrobiota bacterium]